MKCHTGGLESVCISVIARVCNKGSLFQSFLVCGSEMSEGQESTVDQSKFGFVLFSTLAKDGIELTCRKNT